MSYSFAKNVPFLEEKSHLSSFPTKQREEKAQQIFPLQMYQRLLKEGLFEQEAQNMGKAFEPHGADVERELDRKLFRIMTVFSFEGEMLYGCFGGRLPFGFLTKRFQKVIQPGLKMMREFRQMALEDEIQKDVSFGKEKWIFWNPPGSDLVVVGEIGERSKAKDFHLLAKAHLAESQQTASL